MQGEAALTLTDDHPDSAEPPSHAWDYFCMSVAVWLYNSGTPTLKTGNKRNNVVSLDCTTALYRWAFIWRCAYQGNGRIWWVCGRVHACTHTCTYAHAVWWASTSNLKWYSPSTEFLWFQGLFGGGSVVWNLFIIMVKSPHMILSAWKWTAKHPIMGASNASPTQRKPTDINKLE